MKKSDFIFFGLIIFLLLGCLYIVKLIKSETSQCLKNPYLYGASKMGDIYCSCTQHQSSQCPALFNFNDTSFNTPPNPCRDSDNQFEMGNFSFSLSS